MIFGIQKIFPDHLNGFSIDNVDMLSVNHGFRQVLVRQPAKRTPFVSIVHHQEMISLGDELLGNVRMRSVAVDGALSVNDLLD